MAQTMKFPFFDLTRQYKQIQDEVLPLFARLLEKQTLVMGDTVANFEKNVAAYMHVKHAATVASGTDSLILALKTLGIGQGDEVITSAFSFFASTSSIMWAGAKPVFVDIDPLTYNIDVKQIEAKITSKTKAIMPVHLYGQCADMAPIMAIAKKHNLFVLEDYAQSLGAKDGEQFAGAIGHMGATSFYPTKNLGGAGEGGLITTSDDQLADKMKLIRVHGMRVRYHHEFLATNSRLDALQAGYLDIKLKRLDSWVARRSQLAQRYLSELKSLESKGLQLPVLAKGKTHVWNQFVIRVPNRDDVRNKLAELGIPTEVYYPLTIPEQKVLRGICDEKGWPESEKAAKSVMALPIFPELTDDELGMTIDGLKKVL